MRAAKKILIVLLIVFIAAYAFAYAFLALRGKKIIVAQMKNVTQRHVTIGAVHMALPFKVKISNVRIDGIGQISSLDVTPSFLALITGKMAFNSITINKPECTFSMPARQQPVDTAVPLSEAGAPVPEQPSPRIEEAKPVKENAAFMVRRLRIIDGTFVYLDPSVSADTGGVKIKCTDVDVTITNIYEASAEVVTKFVMTAHIPWQDSKERGTVSLNGWMNYLKRDMRAELVTNDIDALSLYPYYANWFSLDKESVEKAKLNFTSSVTGLNNEVTAACHLELTEFGFKQHEAATEQSRTERIANKVLDFFKAMNNGKVVLNFTFKTKMDSPDFGINVIKNAFYDTLTQARKGQGSTAAKVMEMPGQVVGGTVKGVTDVSSALIGGVVSVGKEIGKSIGLSFKKEQPAAETAPITTAQQTQETQTPAVETTNNTTTQ